MSSSISIDIVAKYAPIDELSRNDLIEIGKKIPANLIQKFIRIILETFSCIPLVNSLLEIYFKNRAVKEITKYNDAFIKYTFIPAKKQFSAIKTYLSKQPISIIDFNNTIYKKIEGKCKTYDLLNNGDDEENENIDKKTKNKVFKDEPLISKSTQQIEINLPTNTEDSELEEFQSYSDSDESEEIDDEEFFDFPSDDEKFFAELGDMFPFADKALQDPLDEPAGNTTKEVEDVADGQKLTEKKNIAEQDITPVKVNIQPPKEKTIFDQLLVSIMQSPSTLTTSVLIECCRNFLDPEKIKQLEKSLVIITPMMDNYFLTLLQNKKKLNPKNHKLETSVNKLFDFLSKKDSSSEQSEELAPILKEIIENGINHASIRQVANKIKLRNLKYPSLNTIISPVIKTAFNYYTPNAAKGFAIKIAAKNGLDVYFNKQKSAKEVKKHNPVKEAVIRAEINNVIDILAPILYDLDNEYKIVDFYKITQRFENKLEESPLEENEIVSFTKSLLTEYALKNFNPYYLPSKKILQSLS